MCYSARIEADYHEYTRLYGADISIGDFVKLYWNRKEGAKLRIPKAVDAAFARDGSQEARQVREWIAQYDAQQATKLEQDLFKQRKRLADAQRTLQVKTTKAAQESQRIATDKIAWTLGKLADLRRTALTGEDARIFPGWYAPVLVVENGRRVVKPMRYQCRPAGKPAFYDSKYPGCYNARRDNLRGFWKEQFGHTHGLVVMDAFYENVSRHAVERRELRAGETEENVILEFSPTPPQPMLVACVWSHWRQGDEELLSFAAITDDPPPEIAAAGHDRCVIPIKPANIDAWLNPDPANLDAALAILDDRERPYYEHRLAA
ncbi:SOS response-associated peptidase family protein [Agrilutibacter solisilvae]|uniref:Abasic site processing protein n=1 Tax=Agrilutibacter solisilvae TaxID=2763317 RepID=A0A974Y013_9GAMM|nr:SOS response-associated peptidase family protein [Lysobacter solisilvae]QSX78078.1 SOS response-associated peptidase family protein [Lysobacter solisilvae]